MSEYLAFWSERVILIEIVVVKVLYKKDFLAIFLMLYVRWKHTVILRWFSVYKNTMISTYMLLCIFSCCALSFNCLYSLNVTRMTLRSGKENMRLSFPWILRNKIIQNVNQEHIKYVKHQNVEIWQLQFIYNW